MSPSSILTMVHPPSTLEEVDRQARLMIARSSSSSPSSSNASSMSQISPARGGTHQSDDTRLVIARHPVEADDHQKDHLVSSKGKSVVRSRPSRVADGDDVAGQSRVESSGTTTTKAHHHYSRPGTDYAITTRSKRRSLSVDGTTADSKHRKTKTDVDEHELIAPHSLPQLLSHLNVSDPFPTPSVEFEPTSLLSYSNTVDSSDDHVASTSSSCSIANRASSSISTRRVMKEKRQPISNDHLTQRCKKIKVYHSFYRCESLLFGKSSPTTSPLENSTSSTSSETRSTAFAAPSRLTSTTYKPSPTRKLPSWWASVSRQGGDTKVSKFSPAEFIWVGEGQGWIDAWQELWNRRKNNLSSRDHNNIDSKKEGEAIVFDLVDTERRSIIVKTRSSRSVSSPPTFTSPSLTSRPGEEHNFPWAAPPLKQHLLAVLRMRLAEGGGSSKGGEAGLKFKKWVIWNHWSRRTQPNRGDLEGEFDGTDDDDEDDDYDESLGDDCFDDDDELDDFEASRSAIVPDWRSSITNATTDFFEQDDARSFGLEAEEEMVVLPSIARPDLAGLVVAYEEDPLFCDTSSASEPNYILSSSSSSAAVPFTSTRDCIVISHPRPNLRRSQSVPTHIEECGAPTSFNVVGGVVVGSAPGSTTTSNDMIAERENGSLSPPIACDA